MSKSGSGVQQRSREQTPSSVASAASRRRSGFTFRLSLVPMHRPCGLPLLEVLGQWIKRRAQRRTRSDSIVAFGWEGLRCALADAKRLSCIVYRGNGSCVLSSDKRYTISDKRQMKNDLSSRTSRLQSRNFHNLSSLMKNISMMTMIMVIKAERPSGGL